MTNERDLWTVPAEICARVERESPGTAQTALGATDTCMRGIDGSNVPPLVGAMSVQAMTWALDHSRSRGSTLLVLISIANHAGKYGESAWPGMNTLAKEARITRNTVIAAITELEDMGEVLVYPGKGVPGRGGTTHRYEMPGVSGWTAPKGLTPRKVRDLDTSSVKDARSAEEAARFESERRIADCARTVLIEPSYETARPVANNPATEIRRLLAPKPLKESA